MSNTHQHMRKPHQLATASSQTTALKWLLRVFIASYIFQINADTPNLKITVNSISWLQKHSTSKTGAGAGGGRASIKKNSDTNSRKAIQNFHFKDPS